MPKSNLFLNCNHLIAPALPTPWASVPELRIPIANVGLYHVLLDRRAALKKCVKIITTFELQMLYGTARHIAEDSTKNITIRCLK